MWKCKKCGEMFDERNEKCWACGTPREGQPSLKPDDRAKRAFKYRWKIQGHEYLGTKNFVDENALREHVKKVGGELLEIL